MQFLSASCLKLDTPMFVCACPGMLIFALDWRVRCCFVAVFSHACHFACVGNIRDNQRQSSKSLLRIYHARLHYASSVEKLFKFCFSGWFAVPYFAKRSCSKTRLPALICNIMCISRFISAQSDRIWLSIECPSTINLWNIETCGMIDPRHRIVSSQKITKYDNEKTPASSKKEDDTCSVRLRIRSNSPSCPLRNDWNDNIVMTWIFFSLIPTIHWYLLF